MFKNYFTIAFRKLWRNKFFSFINIAGLGIGISTALVIYLVVQHEFSYEKFHKDRERIYRVVSEMKYPDGAIFKNSGVAMPLPAAAGTDLTGIENSSHFITTYETKVNIPFPGSQSPAEFKKQVDIIYADENYFSIFNYDWISGSKQTALKDPYQVVLTASRAKAYFGNTPAADVVGRSIIYDDSIKTTVAGVINDLKETATNFRFKEFISLATVMKTGLKENFGGDEWGNINSVSQFFVKLKSGTNPDQIESQFAGLRKKYVKSSDDKTVTTHHLQLLTDIHFNSEYDAFGGRQASKSTMYGLLAVASFLLLLACINFINLTTAQSSLRAKEIGIRKTVGSTKRQLVIQFLSETFVLTLLATILSIIIAPWLLNVFKDFIPPEIGFASINQPHVWGFMIALIILVTLLSGLYPAWIMTKFQPVSILKNQLSKNNTGQSRAWFRKTLTVMQFVIAQFLIIATFIVGKQIHYSLNKDLGYKKDAIVYLDTPWDFFNEKEDKRRYTLVEQFKAIPEILNVSLASAPPANLGSSSNTLKLVSGKNIAELMVESKNADPAYFDIYKMKLLAGRFPTQSDTAREFVINETYSKVLGFTNPADAVGSLLERNNRQLPIVGVLADFNTKSTHAAIKPLAYSSLDKYSYMVHVALKPRGTDPEVWKNGIAKMEHAFKTLYPGEDFSYKFFDESIAGFYKSEQDISRLLKWATGLCIFISCLGLLGLVIYITNTRTKEIGVRKVLGASIVQIVSLLSKDFISLIAIAFLIALPIAWWSMHNWLQNFAYRTALNWWVFALSGAGMILIAMIILSMRTIKSASANPVRSLRTE